MLGLLESVDIVKYLGPELFTWQFFATDLAKILSVVFLGIGFFLLSRRENTIGFFIFVVLSFIFAYMGGILKLLGG